MTCCDFVSRQHALKKAREKKIILQMKVIESCDWITPLTDELLTVMESHFCLCNNASIRKTMFFLFPYTPLLSHLR